MVSVRWTTTVLACEGDPRPVAEFWAALLSSEPIRISDDFFAVRHGTAWLAVQRSRQAPPPSWPAGDHPIQIHLDLAVTDLDDAVERAVALGAQEEQQQPAAHRWRVMRAPGGHVFCLSDHIQDYLPVRFDAPNARA